MMKRLPSQSFRVWTTLLFFTVVLAFARAEALGPRANRLLTDVRNDGPNMVGLDLITQNYYEELLKPDREPEWKPFRVLRRFVLRMTGVELGRDEWGERDPDGGRTLPHETGFLGHSLKPDHESIHKGVAVRTNRWGHRDDKDYEKKPEPGVFRVAIVGASNSLGTGVEVEHIYAQLLERTLNERARPPGGFERFEVINLSVHAYHLLERAYVSRHVAPEFHPHLLLMEVTMLDLRRNVRAPLAARVSEGRDLGFDFVREIVRRSNVRPNDSELKIEQRLQRFTDELVIGCFHEIARIQKEIATPIVPLIFRLEVEDVHRNLVQLASIAESAGLDVLRIWDAYEGQSGSEMYIAVDDFHPTAKAHALLTEDIYAKLLAHPRVRPLLIGEERE